MVWIWEMFLLGVCLVSSWCLCIWGCRSLARVPTFCFLVVFRCNATTLLLDARLASRCCCCVLPAMRNFILRDLQVKVSLIFLTGLLLGVFITITEKQLIQILKFWDSLKPNISSHWQPRLFSMLYFMHSWRINLHKCRNNLWMLVLIPSFLF